MEERKTVNFKKEEYKIKEYIKKLLGKGKISKVRIDYIPVGEKIIISTQNPGLIIGKRGERIAELTENLKKNFKLENPQIEIEEIQIPEFDSQVIADDIALGLERFGPLKFKVIAYKALQKIMKAGALGVEIRLGGKLPSSRAKQWRFAQGYLKKTGDNAKVVDIAYARAETKPGTVGIKVSILKPDAILLDRIKIDDNLINLLKENASKMEETKNIKKISKKKINGGQK